ncbi:E3 ubiquitin-protein ligase MARCHF8 [Capsicum galapagoense]
MKSKRQMGEVIINVDDYEFFSTSSSTYLCRICHDEEFESCKNLEAPCACSGTVKYAHRDCIQRWCNEKGNTICEICLQKFEPAYTAPPPKKVHLVDHNTAAIIRGSVEADVENGRERVESDSEEEREMLVRRSQSSECSQAADRSASFCRTIALIFTILLMMRHLLEVLNGGARNYPFTLPTLIIIKATGILLPMYIILLLISRIQIIIRHHYLDSEDRLSNSDQDN